MLQCAVDEVMRAGRRPKRGWDHGPGRRAKVHGPWLFGQGQAAPGLAGKGQLFPGEIANRLRTAASSATTLRNKLLSRAAFAAFSHMTASHGTVFSPLPADRVSPTTTRSNKSFH